MPIALMNFICYIYIIFDTNKSRINEHTFLVHSRDELIALGNRLGLALQKAKRDKPWIICLGADANSGKELIALAIDQALNPQRYPKGITRNLLAEDVLCKGNNGQPQTVFFNFHRIVPLNFDEMLAAFKAESPDARILIAANIERTVVGEFDYPAKGLSSDLLDMNMHVHKRAGIFERSIELTVRDAGFLDLIRDPKALLRDSNPHPRFQEHSSFTAQ